MVRQQFKTESRAGPSLFASGEKLKVSMHTHTHKLQYILAIYSRKSHANIIVQIPCLRYSPSPCCGSRQTNVHIQSH